MVTFKHEGGLGWVVRVNGFFAKSFATEADAAAYAAELQANA